MASPAKVSEQIVNIDINATATVNEKQPSARKEASGRKIIVTSSKKT